MPKEANDFKTLAAKAEVIGTDLNQWKKAVKLLGIDDMVSMHVHLSTRVKDCSKNPVIDSLIITQLRKLKVWLKAELADCGAETKKKQA